MNGKKILQILILFFLMMFFVLLCAIIYTVIGFGKNDTDNTATVYSEQEPETVEDMINQNDATLVSIDDNNVIYVNFDNDLYDENGNSNESYFNTIIDKTKEFYENQSFYLIDEDKNINIYVKYNSSSDSYTITINGKEDYFSIIDGEAYSEVSSVDIVEKTTMHSVSDFLVDLEVLSMKLSALSNYLDEGEELDNGYTSYNDSEIFIKTSPNKKVKNIIFSSKYQDEVIKDVYVGTALKDVLEMYPENAFGSINENYLGYRAKYYYIFVYKDEISAYPYDYDENTTFEEYLSEYIEDKDLSKFARNLKVGWREYETLEYDEEKQTLYVLATGQGIEINIEGNDSTGITLYTNYYFTTTTEDYVKEGLITLNSYEDLVDKVERERRESK